MPVNVVKSVAKKVGKSTKEVEDLWKRSKKLAKKKMNKSNPGYYKYVMGIFKKLVESDYNYKFPAHASAIQSLTIDIPTLIRLLEWAKEEAKTDEEIHHKIEDLIPFKSVDMNVYDKVFGKNFVTYATVKKLLRKHKAVASYALKNGKDPDYIFNNLIKWSKYYKDKALDIVEDEEDNSDDSVQFCLQFNRRPGKFSINKKIEDLHR